MPDKNAANGDPRLHEVSPREISGRDTIARYQSQFRAAAYECLSLLEDDALDRVYCDYQDDYVARLILDGKPIYNFYQVKTKGKRNHQWTINDIFGLYKKRKSASPDKIANSFAGKLLLHTIKFNNSCGKVIFLTNVHLDDDVEACLEAVANGAQENNHYSLLLENFNDAFAKDSPLKDGKIVEFLKKLSLVPNISYLAPDDESFSAIARDTIFKYSEIDLRHGECEEIIRNLVRLVERKSFSKLVPDISEDDLDEIAGVGVNPGKPPNVADLTEVLNNMAEVGITITPELLGGLSPYMREHILRFGMWTLNMDDKPPPLRPRSVPVGIRPSM